MALAEGTSPSLSSASSSSSDVSGAVDKGKLSYDKKTLWSLRQTPASTARPFFLSKEFDSSDGLWDPEKWHKAQSSNVALQPRSGSVNATAPKGVSSKSKGDDDINIVLGPQRRSFGLGCHVTPTAKDLGDRGKPNGFSVADSKDQRYLDGERLEKRNDLRKTIGSGRLQQIPASDHRAGDAVKTRADLEPSWRRDHGSPSFNRGAGDNAKHFGTARAPVLKGSKDEPEWFTADITQEDTIELHGFDVPEHTTTNATRAPNKKLKPSTDSSKPIKEKPSKEKNKGALAATQVESKSVEMPPGNGQNKQDKMYVMPEEQSAAAFDFNKFIEDFSTSFKSFQDEAAAPDMEAKLTSLLESKPAREGSRFSRWFGNTSCTSGEQLTSDQGALPSSTMSAAGASATSPIATSVSNLFKQWDAQEKSGLSPVLGSPPPSHNIVPSSSSTSELTSNLKSLLLSRDSQQFDRKQSELPAELVKRYGHLEARPLPSDGVHTLNEIESAPVVEARWSAGVPKQTIETKGDMPAFQKLVSMLQNAGELSKDMPKMPVELAIKHQPDSQACNVFPGKPAALAFEARSNSPCIPSSSPVPESHRRSLVDAWLRSSDNQEASLAQALEHSPADSPLMFSTQPPGHVAIPAPIHPMPQLSHVQDGRRNGSTLDVLTTHASQAAVAQGGSAFVKPVRPIEGGPGQSCNIDMLLSTGFKHQEEERTVVTPLSSEPSSRLSITSQPVVPAGFTPTSVMRKQASAKVSKRDKTRPVPVQGAGAMPSVGSPQLFLGAMPPVGSPQRESPVVSYGDQWQALLSTPIHQTISGGAVGSGSVEVGEQTMGVAGLPGLAPQAPAITVPALDVTRDPSVNANIPLMNLAAYSQQASYNSIHQAPLLRAPVAPMLHPQMPLVGMSPAMPAVLAVNSQSPLRRPILKSGNDASAPGGLPLVPGHGLLPQSQQLLMEHNRLLPANHDNALLHILNQQHLLQLRLQQQPPPALIHTAIPQSLYAPMVPQGVPRQMPVPPSPELTSVSTMPGVYRNPAINRHQPMAVPGVPGLPLHLSIRADSAAIANEADPLRKWFNHGFLQQMSAMPPPKLGCALNVDDLEAS